MSLYDPLLDEIIDKALNVLFAKNMNLYTFALYYDHETKAVSACADTKANSRLTASQTNAFKYQNFSKFIEGKDLARATNWGRMSERSISLGDFKFQNLAWEPVKPPNNSDAFFIAMVQSLMRKSKHIAALSRAPEELMLCSSSQSNEVEFSWLYQTNK